MKLLRQTAVAMTLMSACSQHGATEENPPSLTSAAFGTDAGDDCLDDDSKEAASLHSTDGIIINGKAYTFAEVGKFAPVVTLEDVEPYLPCSIEYILGRSTINENADGGPGIVVVKNPTQADMAKCSDPSYHVQIGPSAFSGQPARGKIIDAPMYVMVNPQDTFVDLNFTFLYGFNGPQTARFDLCCASFDLQLPSFADHQGDIEAMTVRVTPDLSQIITVRFEAHGNSTFTAPNDILFLKGTQHPLASSALNSHATYPSPKEGFALHTDQADSKIGIGVDFDDFYAASGYKWQPFDIDKDNTTVNSKRLIFIGYDTNKKALNDQTWVSFEGRIGGSQINSFEGAEGTNRPLSCGQSCFSDLLARIIVGVGAVSTDQTEGDGPVGLASRTFIYGGPTSLPR